MPTKTSSRSRAPKRAKTAARPRIALRSAETLSVRELRRRLGLNRDVFARLNGFSVRTIADWESGKAPQGAKAQRMVELQRLQQALARVMKVDFIGTWLQTPNDAFASLKPIEVIERGEIDRIWRMIYEVESGTPS